MKHIYVCWKAIYKYKTYLCNCKAILTLVRERPFNLKGGGGGGGGMFFF